MQRIATPPTGNYKPSLVGIEPASWLFHALLSMSATEVTLSCCSLTTNSCVYGMGDAGRSYVHACSRKYCDFGQIVPKTKRN